MKYKIEPAIGAVRSNLSHSQRTSSLFSETPIVAGQILRRGQSILLDEGQMKQHGDKLKRLADAGAIKVTPIASLEEIGKVAADGIKEALGAESETRKLVKAESVGGSIAEDLKREAGIDKLIESLGIGPAVVSLPEPVAHAESPVVQESTPVPEETPVQVQDELKVESKGKKGRK